jgi:superfamily I DNA and/or RNA helicase
LVPIDLIERYLGNEDDHIIISLTRSEKIGFLKEVRRTNVMLTRCKRSMVICTSRAFLTSVASTSLVAALAERLGPQHWIDSRSIQFKQA